MTKDLQTKKMGTAELMDTMATVSSASEARFGTFWKNDFVPFKICCPYFTLCSLSSTITTRRWVPEAALPLSRGQAAVHRHHRLCISEQAEVVVVAGEAAGSAAERADNGYI